jgi:hypothetical protein
MQIEDGTGKGTLARVDNDNNLHTSAMTTQAFAEKSRVVAKAFCVKSGIVPLTTTGAYSGILWLKYTGSQILRIAQLRTDGNVNARWRLIKDVTAGTLVTGGTADTPLNLNLTSGSSLNASVQQGADALTVTDGSDLCAWINGVGLSNSVLDGALILGQNDAFALMADPDAAGDVSATLFVWEENK